ncbi:MAG: DUF3054 domain-containing protein [Actinomycetota bacterium]
MSAGGQRRDDLLAVGLDLAVVAGFATVGRATHGEGTASADVLRTALPFAVAALTAHLVLSWRRRSPRPVLAGLFVWAVTILGGLVGRLLLGATAEGAFALVAGAVLAAGMLLWRLVNALLGRSRTRSRRQAP